MYVKNILSIELRGTDMVTGGLIPLIVLICLIACVYYLYLIVKECIKDEDDDDDIWS